MQQFKGDRLGLVLAYWGLALCMGRLQVSQACPLVSIASSVSCQASGCADCAALQTDYDAAGNTFGAPMPLASLLTGCRAWCMAALLHYIVAHIISCLPQAPSWRT